MHSMFAWWGYDITMNRKKSGSSLGFPDNCYYYEGHYSLGVGLIEVKSTTLLLWW